MTQLAKTNDVTVTTGTFGKLTINDKEIYLAPEVPAVAAEPGKPGVPGVPNKLPVPRFLYKVIEYNGQKEVYVVSNDIKGSKDAIVKDMKKTFGDNLEVIDGNHLKGYAVKISYDDLEKVIKPELDAPNLRKSEIDLWNDKLKNENPNVLRVRI